MNNLTTWQATAIRDAVWDAEDDVKSARKRIAAIGQSIQDSIGRDAKNIAEGSYSSLNRLGSLQARGPEYDTAIAALCAAAKALDTARQVAAALGVSTDDN